MPSFKPDSSFFHKIAMGAIGSRTVKQDLASYGHELVELERGSLEAKIWKEVKRKRVRIPDLVCTCCGQRIEVRTKSEARISMSHSPAIPERAWNYGMVSNDWIALPVCHKQPVTDERADHWTRGMVIGNMSYWNEKAWVRWHPAGAVNYFMVRAFREVNPDRTERKGAEEGAESTLTWRACFAPVAGTVHDISDSFITIRAADGGRKRVGRRALTVRVRRDESVSMNQILACNAAPLLRTELRCPGKLTDERVAELLRATQLPVRFAGLKLARVKHLRSLENEIRRIATNADEDIYVRLEAKAYLCAVIGDEVATTFAGPLSAHDKPDQLEAVIAIGEVGNASAAAILAAILGDSRKDYFLRSAAAYCLGRLGSHQVARQALVTAFAAQSRQVREDALVALAEAGFGALTELLAGLVQQASPDIQAGCAEAVRWLAHRSDSASVAAKIAPGVADVVRRGDRPLMAVWLSGQLSPEIMRPALGAVLEADARLAYALSVAWAFSQSWISPLYDGFVAPSRT